VSVSWRRRRGAGGVEPGGGLRSPQPQYSITGEVYEFVRKFQLDLLPGGGLSWAKVDEFADPVGVMTVSVRCIVPVGRISPEHVKMYYSDPEYRSLMSRLIVWIIADRGNWKRPAECALKTDDLGTAVLLADAVAHTMGGAWVINAGGDLYVWSKGYYSYVGA